MFTMNLSKMGVWEQKKAMYLLSVALDLGMEINDRTYGELSVNKNSGYVYLWLEDYPFCLYMPISCELNRDHVYASYSDPNDGEEYEIELEDRTIDDLYNWVKDLEENI